MNIFRAALRNSSVYLQIFTLIALALFGVSVMSAMGLLACKTFLGLDTQQLIALFKNPNDVAAIPALKIIQLFTSIGIFLLPAMVFSQLASPHPTWYLQVNRALPWPKLLAIVLLIVAITPLTDGLSWLNDRIHLPTFLADFETSARASAQNQLQLVAEFLHMQSIADFAYNLILLALIPALAEEFFFRGIVQRLLKSHTQRMHLSVWITALAFALMHGQIFALIPFVVLGALLGYLKELTGNLWAPIVAHFVNNASIVVVMYFTDYNMSNLELQETPNVFYVLGSALIVGVLLWYLIKNKPAPIDENADLKEEII